MRTSLTILFVAASGFFAPLLGCSQERPPFLDEIIAEYEAVSDSAASKVEIWQYEYEGKTVFYLPFARTHCCDALSMVYDSQGTVICMPEGGITGKGDGRCPDFSASRSRGVQVYNGSDSASQ